MKTKTIAAVLIVVGGVSGCASTYSNLVSGNNLGAQEYKPAVYVPSGKEEQYNQVLGICRQVATNRQVTAAQEAQLKTITGAASGSAEGLATGLEIGGLMKSVSKMTDSDTGGMLTQGATLGLATGLISSLASSFSSGTEDTAEETKRILLNCLRSEQAAVGYKVME